MYSIDEIKNALIPVLGDGEAMKIILTNLGDPKNVDEESDVIKMNYIVVGPDNMLYRVVAFDDNAHAGKRIFKCKSWDGNVIQDFDSDQISHATHKQRAQYYKNQVDFLRTNIAPFLNYFHFKQLYVQLRDEDSKNKMESELDQNEAACFTKLQGIKKLW